MSITSEIVNFCDASIVSFMDLPILYTNSPNKLFDSLSAGKPIIVNSAGWTKDLVEANECGYYVNPNKPQELVDKILYLQANPGIATMMGTRSRKLAEREYDKSILCKKFVEVVENIVVK
ncbi:putative glycosyl transferase [compost metagenome]